jgi:DNA-binding transcriptional ArsR family regulator
LLQIRSTEVIRKPTIAERSAAERIAHSVGHPMRVDAFALLGERTASPKEIADEIGVTVNKVSFHVKELQRAGCIELVRTEPRRGAVEHYYRARRPPTLSEDEWRDLGPEQRLEVAAIAFQVVVVEGLTALREESENELRVERRELRLDEQGRLELARAQAEMLARVERIGVAGADRLRRSGEAGSVTVYADLRVDRGRRRP